MLFYSIFTFSISAIISSVCSWRTSCGVFRSTTSKLFREELPRRQKKNWKKLQICFRFVSQDYKSKLPFSVQSGNTPFTMNCILAGLAGRDLLFGRWLAPLSFVPGTPTRNCLSSGTGPPNNFSSWTAARSLSRDVGFETPRWSVTRRNTHYGPLSLRHIRNSLHESEANAGSLLLCKLH